MPYWQITITRKTNIMIISQKKLRNILCCLSVLPAYLYAQTSQTVTIYNASWIRWGIYLAFILLCILLYILYKRCQAEKNRLQERMDSFLGMIHDIRTPVTLMKASLSELESQQTLSESNRKQVKVATKNVDKLLDMLNRLLQWQKNEIHKNVLELSRCDIETFLEEKITDFKSIAAQKGIELTLETTHDLPTVWIDERKMSRIVENLLSNALRYTEQGTVSVHAKSIGKRWELEISDTGIGIPHKDQKRIFGRFYRADNARNMEDSGLGLGLMITHKMVRQHQGAIKITSQEGKGSTFSLSFPVYPKKGLRKIMPPHIHKQHIKTQEALQASQENGKDVLLLAEDDEDMREYLEQSLSEEYKIISVSDGGKALEMAKKINPDLIISDVVMPVLQGDELCRILKSSLETSHIPVILLTALSERENIIFGLEAGANDYIIKPFDLSVLKARLRNVIQNRQRLRSAVLSAGKQSDEIDYSSQLDKEFLDKVMEIVNGELSNPDFSINDFCRKIGMSRTSVYNKIKTLTGQGPNDFIRIMRLNKAMELLKTRRHTIGEVSSLVGFSDPKYFSTCFKKQFGVSPSKI